ncbi:MAG: xanthine dehydrogenase family protein molybdopterin-binding subunit [Deltaproteobacteria bacterium]|nr:xanthine dehydrogenase family protein molybdopterin-binding subunit [Deltaproteobacteria bacterium]
MENYRVDAYEKVTGKAVYITDMAVKGMAYAKAVRSPLPRARIQRIDTDAAEQRPGVICVLTHRDLGDIVPYYGPAFKDTPILAIDQVRYVGEPVALVIADSEAEAEDACALVQTEFEELPAVLTLEDALKPGAPLVQEGLKASGHFRDLRSLHPVPGTNICNYYRYEQGNVEQAFKEADEIFDHAYTLPALFHYSMEPHAAIGQWSANDVTVWSSSQNPLTVRKELSEIFDLPLAAVNVIVPLIGGAFGSKCYTRLEPLVVAASRKAGRPVRLALSVDEACKTITRHGARCRFRTAVKKDGTIIGRWCEVDLDTGAYADLGPRVAQRAGYTASGPYRIPHLRLEARAVLTNKVPAGAYRGYGVPQAAWASECQLDAIAEKLGLDPIEFRKRNLPQKGEEFRAGDLPMESELASGIEQMAKALEWSKPAAKNYTGKGIACGIKTGGGTHSVSTAIVRLHVDGTVTVLAAVVEHGQGSRTVLARIAAKVLDLPIDRVYVFSSGTSVVPFDQGSSASRTSTVTGRAVQLAAEAVRKQLFEAASKQLGAAQEQLRAEAGYILAGEEKYPYGWVVAEYFGMPGGELIGVGVARPERFEGPLGAATLFWEVGMGGAEVKVDPETGGIEVLRYVSVSDAGWVVNHVAAQGQEEGASMMALGHALFEELRWEDGQLLNPNLVDYRVPRFAELPRDLRTILLENGDGPGPFGAKGVGESGVFSVAPAIANAVRRATGVEIRDLPLNPERVWRALKRAGKS